MPQAIVPALLSTVASIGTKVAMGAALSSITAAMVVKSFAINLALSAAAKALTPKPSAPGISGQKQTITAKQSNQTRKLVYGETRVGGTIVFVESTDDDKYLHLVIVLAAHEVNSINTIYFDEKALTISSNNVTAPSRFENYAKIYTVTKGTSANIPASLISDTSWTSNHVLTDQAYIYARLEYNSDAFPTGLPNISAIIQGKKVYDTRSSSTIFSQNPAMILRDYLTDSTYGLGATSSEIDETSFQTAANLCDENVSLSGGGTEKRYTLNGLVDTGDTPKSIIEDLLTSMNGSLQYLNGQWALKAGGYTTPTVVLDEDDFAGEMTITTSISARDSFNAIKGQFVSSETEFQPSDYPEITSSTFETEDNSEKRYLNLDLPFTTSSATAQRIAKQVLYRNRQEITIQAKLKLTAFQFQVGDTLMINNSRMGFTNKPFEVVSWQLAFSDNEVVVDCILSETNSSVYSWTAEETAFQQDNTTLPSAVLPPTPTNLTLTATAVVNDDGITIPAIRADWDVVDGGFVQYYEIQFKRLGGEEDYGSITVSHDETENWASIADAYTSEEDYGLINETILSPDAQYTSILGTSNSYTIIPVLNGYDYNIRVRSINSFGARSSFATATLASAGDTTAPGTPSGLNANALYKSIELSWTNPADQDLDYIEIWENTTDNIGTASLIGTASATSFLRAGLANNVTRYYWIRAVDLSLNKSDYTSSVNATTLLIAPNDFNTAVNDLFQEAGAFGIEPVSSLPSSGDFDGQIVLLLTDVTLYRWDDATSSWSDEIYTDSGLGVGTVTASNFAAGIEPISVVSALPTVSGYTGPNVVFLTTDQKLYRFTGSAWTAAVSTQDLSGELGEGLFSSDLRPVERVSALPTTDLTQGRVVLLTTDNKLYRYTGSAWTSDIAASDLTGQISGTQVADGAITTTKITDDAVTSDKVAANAVYAGSIQTNAVTSAKIQAGAISTDKIAANAITAAKMAADSVEAGSIAAGAVNTAAIQAGAINADKIGTDAVTANKIAASSIITSKIATGAVTAAKISVSELSAVAAEIGTFQSAASGARLVITDDVIKVYDASGTLRVQLGDLT